MGLNYKIPVVYITPYEHHSNILPWQVAGCKIVIIDNDKFGNIDSDKLLERLILNQNYRL